MILLVLHWLAFGVALYALVDALARPAAAYAYAGVRRGLWLGLLGVAAAVTLLFSALSILAAAGVVAALVFLLEHRPKLRLYAGRNGRSATSRLRARRFTGRRRTPSGPSPWS